MNLLDMRTVLFSYAITSFICAGVMAMLWLQNRRRTPELGFWLADFVMQFAGLLLVGVFRSSLPDFYSMVLSNTLIIGGTVLLFIGLERYNGKTGPQWHNYLYLALFILVQMFFVYVQPSLLARNLNISLGLLMMCTQCAWLLLRRVEPTMRPGTRMAGVVFFMLSLVNLVRIYVDLNTLPENDFFKSGLYDSLFILSYQMLYIWLTLALFLMVDRRLLTALEKDISERELIETALKVSIEKFSVAFNNIPDALVITTLQDGKIIEANPSFFRLSEYGKEESLGRTTVDLNLWGSLADRNKLVDALRMQGRVLNLETEFRRKSGMLFSGAISSEIIQLQGQQYVLNVIHDLTETKQAERALQWSENRFHTLFDQAAVGVALVDTKTGRFLEINQRYCDLLGYSKSEMLNFSFQDVTYPDNIQDNLENNALLLTGKIREFSIEKRYICKDGRIVWGELTVSPLWVPDEETSYTMYIAVVQDITRRKEMEKAYQESMSSLQAILHSTAEGILAVGIENEVLFANERFADMWRIPQTVMASKDDGTLLRHVLDQLSDPEGFLKKVQELYKSNNESFDTVIFKDGRVLERVSRPLNQGAIVRGRVWSFRDITERKRLEEEIRNLSLTDELTGLYNRKGFTLLAEQEIKLAHRVKRTMLLFFGDVDNLKTINDTRGHACGDLALKQISAILKECFREADILARIGGDEFVALASDASIESAEIITNRIQSALEERYRQGDKTYHLSLSVGIARYDPEAPCTLNELIARADDLMYVQKQARRKID